MALITKNGQIHPIPTKKGKQKGLITKNGEISTLIPYLPIVVVVEEEEEEETDLGFSAVSGVAVASVSAVMGVAKASISKVSGV